MSKYRAKVDVLPIKKGDIVEFKDPLIPEYESKFEAYTGEEAPAVNELDAEIGENGGGTVAIVNPSREELKKLAADLQIDYAPNIPTDKLLSLVQEAQKAKDEDEGNGGPAPSPQE